MFIYLLKYGVTFVCTIILVICPTAFPPFYKEKFWDPLELKYGTFSDELRIQSLNETKEMFYFAYDNYMKYAFPKDELDPIHCIGRGPDYDNPSNININDVLGDYALTLIDVLDTLAIMGNSSEFEKAIKLIIENVSFDKSNTVQLFEANIRVLGALLSTHLILTDPVFKDFVPELGFPYEDELLHMSHDLATRLLSAFDNTATGVPHPRINLQNGVPCNSINETCVAGAGSLRIEFGILSRLLGDPIYDRVAKNTVDKIWSFRSNVTGLFGNVMNIQTGEWVGIMSGLGAGLDSFYEYLFKSFILFGDHDDLEKFNKIYESIKHHLRRGREKCNDGVGVPPIYINVNMFNGEPLNNWIDSLQASWSAVQVLQGDIEEAICTHAYYFSIWQKYNALPERYNWLLHKPDVKFYPLRPEFAEATYHLYRATLNPFYLHVGRDILLALNNHTKVQCGYATRHDVTTNELEDRMESFFLSETCKYLFLLFDVDNFVNKHAINFLFTTEGHIVPISPKLRDLNIFQYLGYNAQSAVNVSSADSNCENFSSERRFALPILPRYFNQLQQMMGL